MKKINITVLNNSKYYWPGKKSSDPSCWRGETCSGARPCRYSASTGQRSRMSWYKGIRVFFGGGLSFRGNFSSQGGCSGVSGCAQGPGAGQAVLVRINRLRLLAIRAAAAGPGGEKNAFVSPVYLAARRDCWKAKRTLNEPRPSIIIKASPRNQSCYLPAHMTGKSLPLVAAKPGSEPTRGLSAQGTAVDVGQGCQRAPGPRHQLV